MPVVHDVSVVSVVGVPLKVSVPVVHDVSVVSVVGVSVSLASIPVNKP